MQDGALGAARGPRRPGHPVLLRSVGNHIAQLDRALVGFFHPALAQPIAWDVRRAPALLPVLARVRSPSMRRVLSTALEPHTTAIAANAWTAIASHSR